MNRPLLASALGAFVLFAPLAVQAQNKLDPTALAMSGASLSGGSSSASVSPVSAATTPYDNSATATTGTDNAGNYTGSDYNGGNYGAGFTPFNVVGNNGGSFIGSSNGIDTNGKSFGLYANSNNSNATVNITRGFANPLIYVGDSFSIDLRTNFYGANGNQTLQYVIGGANLTLSSSGYTLNGVPVLSQGDYILNASYTVEANSTYQFTVQSKNSADTTTATGSYTQAVKQFQIIGTNLPQDQFFNNLTVTNNSAPVAAPEPSGTVPLLIGAMALGGLIIKRRRAASATVTDTP